MSFPAALKRNQKSNFQLKNTKANKRIKPRTDRCSSEGPLKTSGSCRLRSRCTLSGDLGLCWRPSRAQLPSGLLGSSWGCVGVWCSPAWPSAGCVAGQAASVPWQRRRALAGPYALSLRGAMAASWQSAWDGQRTPRASPRHPAPGQPWHGTAAPRGPGTTRLCTLLSGSNTKSQHINSSLLHVI